MTQDWLIKTEVVEVGFTRDDVMEWIDADDERREWFQFNLLDEEDRPEPLTMIQEITSMPSLDRDRFLADLCRECALLGIEWPASPKDETQRITKPKDFEHG